MSAVDQIVLYIKALWPHCSIVFSSGVFLGADKIVSRTWPYGQSLLDSINPKVRQKFELSAILLAFLYAGFAAWSQEHEDHEQTKNTIESLNQQNLALSLRNDTLKEAAGTYMPRHIPRSFQGKLKSIVASDDYLRNDTGKLLPISLSSSTDNDSASLAYELSQALKNSGIKVYYLGVGPQVGEEVGYVFYLLNPEAPSEYAVHIMNALSEAGLIMLTLKWEDKDPSYPLDFNIFVTRDRKAPK